MLSVRDHVHRCASEQNRQRPSRHVHPAPASQPHCRPPSAHRLFPTRARPRGFTTRCRAESSRRRAVGERGGFARRCSRRPGRGLRSSRDVTRNGSSDTRNGSSDTRSGARETPEEARWKAQRSKLWHIARVRRGARVLPVRVSRPLRRCSHAGREPRTVHLSVHVCSAAVFATAAATVTSSFASRKRKRARATPRPRRGKAAKKRTTARCSCEGPWDRF